MRRIYEIRLTNARKLADEAGNALRFGERLGISKSQVSQIIGRSPVRMVGDDLAERMEKEFGRPDNWLDQDHSAPLLDMVTKLNPGNRMAVVDLMRALLKEQRADV